MYAGAVFCAGFERVCVLGGRGGGGRAARLRTKRRVLHGCGCRAGRVSSQPRGRIAMAWPPAAGPRLGGSCQGRRMHISAPSAHLGAAPRPWHGHLRQFCVSAGAVPPLLGSSPLPCRNCPPQNLTRRAVASRPRSSLATRMRRLLCRRRRVQPPCRLTWRPRPRMRCQLTGWKRVRPGCPWH